MRLVVAAVAGAAIVLANNPPLLAQPMVPEGPTALEQKGGGGGTKIPVDMRGGTEVLGAESAAASAPPAPISLEHPIDPNQYVCGPGDVFELNFWGQQNFRLRIAADLEGRAFISKVGFVEVNGKTLTEVRHTVEKKVRGTYPGLRFELTLASPRSFLVHIVDNVKQPGRYIAHPLDRVSGVLEQAGGSIGSRRRITIKHQTGNTDTADLVMYELTGDTSYDPFVLDGDIISVPAAELTVTIRGAVRRPGSYELVRTKDVAELLKLAGGFTSAVAKSLPLRIVRRDAKDHEAFIEVALVAGTPKNEELRDLDQVEVRGALELQRSILLIGPVTGADPLDNATTSRRLPYIEGDTVLSVLDRAGGIKVTGDLHRSYISRLLKDGSSQQIPIDLQNLLVKRDFSADKKVEINDTIVIPPMQYSILVEGAVARAGLYPFNPQFGLAEYIAHAGGRTRTARDLDEVKLIDWAGKTHDYQPGMKLAPGDAILVPERNFTRAEIVQIVIAGAGLALSGIAIGFAATR